MFAGGIGEKCGWIARKSIPEPSHCPVEYRWEELYCTKDHGIDYSMIDSRRNSTLSRMFSNSR